jgi:hypothetical protein
MPLKKRFQALAEELAGFLLSEVIPRKGTYNGE